MITPPLRVLVLYTCCGKAFTCILLCTNIYFWKYIEDIFTFKMLLFCSFCIKFFNLYLHRNSHISNLTFQYFFYSISSYLYEWSSIHLMMHFRVLHFTCQPRGGVVQSESLELHVLGCSYWYITHPWCNLIVPIYYIFKLCHFCVMMPYQVELYDDG